MQWVLPVILYNLACEAVFCNTWHWLTYAGPYAQGRLKDHKLNKDNQYLTPDEAKKFKKVCLLLSRFDGTFPSESPICAPRNRPHVTLSI
eukprot:SAG31_NODE_325_length_17671_cov_9.902743_18_plen_90_part_00